MSATRPYPAALSFLRDRRVIARIVVVTLVVATIGFVYGLVTPKWYQATLTIVPSTASRTVGVSSLLGSELGGLAAGLGAVGGGNADAARIVAVLQSNTVTDAAIDKFDLMTRYGSKYRETARDEVRRRCDVKALPKPNLVMITCEDTDPRFLQEFLSFLADHGNQVFRRVSKSSASEEVRFLEARATELRQQADDVSAKVRQFQETHQLVDLDTQAKALVSEVAALNSQRISKKLELDYARSFASRDEATARQLEAQLSVVNDQLLDLEERQPRSREREGASASRGGKTGLFPPALAVPKLRAEYEKLYRDRKVAEATLVFVLERLEGAKAAEARNVSTFQVLDPPVMPTRKTRPARMAILAGAILLGLTGSLAFEWLRAGGGKLLRQRMRASLASTSEKPSNGAAR